MTRSIPSVASRTRRKKTIKLAKGYRGNRSKLYRNSRESVNRARQFSYVGRKLKKRDFRSLWILRINAATRAHGLTYSRLINGLKKANVQLNRKQLAELSINSPADFEKIVNIAKENLKA